MLLTLTNNPHCWWAVFENHATPRPPRWNQHSLASPIGLVPPSTHSISHSRLMCWVMQRIILLEELPHQIVRRMLGCFGCQMMSPFLWSHCVGNARHFQTGCSQQTTIHDMLCPPFLKILPMFPILNSALFFSKVLTIGSQIVTSLAHTLPVC